MLEGDSIRREIVCDCGQVMVFLGREEFQLDAVSLARRTFALKVSTGR